MQPHKDRFAALRSARIQALSIGPAAATLLKTGIAKATQVASQIGFIMQLPHSSLTGFPSVTDHFLPFNMTIRARFFKVARGTGGKTPVAIPPFPHPPKPAISRA